MLESYGRALSVAVIGASGGLGQAFVAALAASSATACVVAASRSESALEHDKVQPIYLDLEDECTIAKAAAETEGLAGRLHLVIVATGFLHDGDRIRPEKSWSALSAPAMATAFRLNAIGPSLVAKHFLPLLAEDRKAAFAALSARVGSIEDNALGGWHAYRASKAALNMVIKTLSIELARRRPQALCVGLHPGTVDSALSKPFQKGLPESRLFTPDQSAGRLLELLEQLSPAESGGLFAWDGQSLPY